MLYVKFIIVSIILGANLYLCHFLHNTEDQLNSIISDAIDEGEKDGRSTAELFLGVCFLSRMALIVSSITILILSIFG